MYIAMNSIHSTQLDLNLLKTFDALFATRSASRAGGWSARDQARPGAAVRGDRRPPLCARLATGPLPFPTPTFGVSMVWHWRDAGSPSTAWLRDRIRAAVGAAPSS